MQEPSGAKYHLERKLKLPDLLADISLPLVTQWVLLGVIAMSQQLLLQVGELPPGVLLTPGELGKLPTNKMIDASEGLVENHRVLDVHLL